MPTRRRAALPGGIMSPTWPVVRPYFSLLACYQPCERDILSEPILLQIGISDQLLGSGG